MPSKTRFSIEGVVSLVQKVTMPMKQATKAVTGFSRKMRNQFRLADMSAQKINRSINRIGAPAAKAGLAALGVGVAVVGKQFVEFDDAIFAATARFKAAEKPGTDMTKVMENLRKEARKMGATTQFSAVLMAQGLDKFALAGFTSKEAIMSLKTQVDLATVTGEDFMRVADISSDLLGAFGGSALDSTAKIAKLKEMNSLLAVATLSANVTMEDLFETLKQAAPIGTMLGKSMADVIATTSVLGSAGIKGSMAATAMKNIFLRLVKPTEDVNEALRQMNLKQKDFVTKSGKMKSTVEIFKLINQQTKKFSDVKVARLFAALAGLRGTAGAAVIAKNVGEIRKQLIKMGKDPQKVMAQTAAFMRQSMGNRIKALGSAFTELGFKIFSAFAGDGKKGIDKMTKSILKFDVKPIIALLKVLVGVFKVFGSVLMFLAPFMNLIIASFVGFKVAMLVASVAAGIFGVTLNFAVLGPIMLIIGVITFLALVIVKNWDFIKQVTFQVWGNIKRFFGEVLDGMKIGMFTFVDMFMTTWGNLFKFILMGYSKVKGALGGDTTTVDAMITKVSKIQADVRAKSAFASPNSRGQNGTTNKTEGTLNLNVQTPAGSKTDTSTSGVIDPFTLNLGEG